MLLKLVNTVSDSGIWLIYGLLKQAFVDMEQYVARYFDLANIMNIQKAMPRT